MYVRQLFSRIGKLLQTWRIPCWWPERRQCLSSSTVGIRVSPLRPAIKRARTHLIKISVVLRISKFGNLARMHAVYFILFLLPMEYVFARSVFHIFRQNRFRNTKTHSRWQKLVGYIRDYCFSPTRDASLSRTHRAACRLFASCMFVNRFVCDCFSFNGETEKILSIET